MIARSRISKAAVGGALALGVLLAGCAPASSADDSSAPTAFQLGSALEGSDPLPAETAELEQLYGEAMAEGGRLVVWAGGDAANRQDVNIEKFQQRFPDIDLEVVVDLSKFHNLRVEEAVAGEGELPDAIMLQTTFDFDDWSERDLLLPFEPAGLDHQLPGYAHPEGDYITGTMHSFRPTFAAEEVPAEDAPTGYEDFLDEQYADGRLALTYPHDDDAVLWVYDQLQERFGVEYLEALRDQEPRWMRGTAGPAFAVGQEGLDVMGNLTGYDMPPTAPAITPADDEPFVVWNQRAAVFNDSPNQAAGKLWLSFIASKEFQSTYTGWRTRDDLPPSGDLPPVEDLPGTDPQGFIDWMADREQVAEVRQQMTDLFGPVQGETPLLDEELWEITGVTPDRANALPEPEGAIR